MPTRGDYTCIPAIFRDYSIYKTNPIAREWLSNDNGGIYYVKSDGKTIIDVGEMILREHVKNGSHNELDISGLVHFTNPFKIKIDGSLFGATVTSNTISITDNLDGKGNPLEYTISIKNTGDAFLPISNGGTGVKAIAQGAVTSDGTKLYGGVLPIKYGGTGQIGFKKGALFTNGTTIGSGTLSISYGGTGSVSIEEGAVISNGSSLSGGVLPVKYGGTGRSSLGNGVIFAKNNVLSFLKITDNGGTVATSKYVDNHIDSVNDTLNDAVDNLSKEVNSKFSNISTAFNNHIKTKATNSDAKSVTYGHTILYNKNPGWATTNGTRDCTTGKNLSTGEGKAVGTGLFNTMMNGVLTCLNGKVGTDGSIKYMGVSNEGGVTDDAYTYVYCALARNYDIYGALNGGAGKSAGNSPFKSFRFTQPNLGIHVWVSDKRLKENIIDTTEHSALKKILDIDHKSFNFIGKKSTVKVGYIAQDLEKIERSFVTHVPNDPSNFDPNDENSFTYQINEPGIIPYITKGMQELYNELKKENVELKEEVNELRSELMLIKNKLLNL